MKSITINFYADSGHSWGKVSLKLIKDLGIADKISHYSYMRGKFAYLEEDCDAGVLVHALKASGYTVKYKEFITNKSSKIRSYDSYSTKKIDWDSLTVL